MLSFEEIALILSVNSNTIRVWHMRAKKEMFLWIKRNYL
ncbi:sigma factor-like helix-turn-helix DNA-binding protein [Clostridium tetani]